MCSDVERQEEGLQATQMVFGVVGGVGMQKSEKEGSNVVEGVSCICC